MDGRDSRGCFSGVAALLLVAITACSTSTGPRRATDAASRPCEHPYCGVVFEDALFGELPGTLKGSGEAIAGDDVPLGYVHALDDGGRHYLLLDRFIEDPPRRFVIVDVLELGLIGERGRISYGDCSRAGAQDRLIVAVGAAPDECGDASFDATRAWRVDVERERFEAIDAAGVRCLRNDCADPNQVPMGVQGGVIGPE